MAECIEAIFDLKPDWKLYKDNYESQVEEIEVLKSFYDNTDNFDVIEEASIEEGRLFSLQFKVKVDKQDNLEAEVWLPIEKTKLSEADLESLALDDSTTKKDEPKLQRSLSGKRAHTTIKCNYLPFLNLEVILPHTYPSETKPNFKLSCVWLSKSQLVQLCHKLDEIWSENKSNVILYYWIDWLQSDLVNCLEIFEKPNKIILTPMNNFNLNETNDDIRANCTFIDSDNLIYIFLTHNFVEDTKQFNNSVQSCMICFDEKIGQDFFRLNKCKHHFCADCMSSMCQMHVKEGTIQFLKCPENDCDELVPIDVMQSCLDAEEFDRWERLLLQRTLDSMEDIMYCPRCSQPIVIENTNNHSFCMYCKMDYCRECKDLWHVGPCLNAEQKANEKLKRVNLTIKQLLAMTDEEIKKFFNAGSTAILDIKKKATENQDNEKIEALLKKYLKCPKCKAFIEKIDGCNKVVCICGTILCYVCGKIITGYDHFNDNSCNLWTTVNSARQIVRPLHEGQQAVNRIINLVPEQQKYLISCPTCAQRSLKSERNNHIKCWLCSTNFCYCCKKKIVGVITDHFRKGPCKQHSD